MSSAGKMRGASGDAAKEDPLQRAETLRQKHSEIEGIINERKRNRAKILDRVLSGTTVLGTELERLKILSDEEEKSKFVSSLARGGSRARRLGEKAAFNLADVLSSRQTDFERRQESQAFHIAKLRGQLANAATSLKEFKDRRAEDGAEGGAPPGEDQTQPQRSSAVLRKLEKTWIGDNFRLRCLRSQVEATRSVLEKNRVAEEPTTSGRQAGAGAVERHHNAGDLDLVRSILLEVVDSSVEEASKREALVSRKGGRAADDAGRRARQLAAVVRIIGNEYLAEAVREAIEETYREILRSREEAKSYARRLVTNALVAREAVLAVKPSGEGDTRRATSRKVRSSLASVLGGMGEGSAARGLFSGSSVFNELLGEFPEGEGVGAAAERRSRLNLEKMGRDQRSGLAGDFQAAEEDFWSRVKVEPENLGVEAGAKTELCCLRCSYDGAHLAAGTSAGELLVWDLRSGPGLVLRTAARRKSKKAGVVGVLSLCWSYNNAQVSVLFTDASLAVYSLKAASRQALDAAEAEATDEHKIASVSSGQLSKSSRFLDRGAAAAYPEGSKVSFAFHPSFNVAGFYPRLIVPSAWGDVTVVTVERGGSLEFQRDGAGRREGTVDERAMDFLSRPPVAKQGIKQVICHGHKAAVIFAGYSWDNSNLVTVDALGQISLWSCSQAKRSGFGWYVPDETWDTSLSLSVLCVKELLEVGAAKPGEGAPPGGREEDRDHDAEIENMREWVTSYRVVGSKRSAVIVRQVVHVSKGPAKGGSTAYVSLYSAGELRGRELVKAAWEKVPFEVCGASFTSQNHELVLVTKSKAPEEEEEREVLQPHFSVFLVCLKTGNLKAPRMDVAFHEDGRPPAYALGKTVPVLGTEYLYFGLGCGHVGVFSFATGAMVKDIELDLPPAAAVLELGLVEARDGDDNDLLCTRCSSDRDKGKLYFFQIADQAALEHSLGVNLSKLDRPAEVAETPGGETEGEEESDEEEEEQQQETEAEEGAGEEERPGGETEGAEESDEEESEEESQVEEESEDESQVEEESEEEESEEESEEEG